MFKLDAVWFLVLADLSIDLSAAFYASIVLASSFSSLESPVRLAMLTANFVSGTVLLFLARWLRKRAGGRQ